MGPCVPCTPGVEAGARKGLGGPAPPLPGLRRRGRRSCQCRHRELWRSEGPGASEGAGAAPGGVSAVPTVVLCGLEKQRRSQGLRRLRPGKAFWAGEQRCEGGRRGRGWGGGAASCPRFSWWGTVGPSSGLSVVLSSDVFLPSASAHPISKLLRSFLREASLGFSDRGGSPAPACSAHLCRDASVCWFICVAPPPLTLTHTH